MAASARVGSIFIKRGTAADFGLSYWLPRIVGVARAFELCYDGGLLDALKTLQRQGKTRFLGFTVEEPWTAKPLIASGQFDVIQVRYNLIYQSAALHVLDEATKADMGIAVMRPLTSGIFQRMAQFLAPNWHSAHDLYEVALKFVLSDSRVHVANLGMRWPEEVAKNVSLAESFKPPFDMAELPRMTADIYKTADESAGRLQS